MNTIIIIIKLRHIPLIIEINFSKTQVQAQKKQCLSSYQLRVAPMGIFFEFNVQFHTKIESDYAFRLPMRQNEKFEFIIRLCHDVLVEALLFGDRRQLIKLERVGRRFHRIIEDFFRRIPFLCLSLGIDRFLIS